MNVLLLNWRDPKNPKSGGAEKLNMHILKPLVERGDTVTWYAMAVKGLPRYENYKGIVVIRFGNPFTHLFFWPFLYVTGKLGKPDLIIDSIHGTGYLSSVFAPTKKKVILICEVAQNIWDEMYGVPINTLGRLWEKIMFLFYKHNNFWTISQSTKKDLIQFGIQSKNIEMIPMGFDAINLNPIPTKSKYPTALFVGRLTEMKGVNDAINAIAEINKSSERKWNLKIIGRGEEKYETDLKLLVEKLDIQQYVKFLGYVSEKEKFLEMAKAWILVVPSSREGWGMIIPEANSVGTSAIGYDVPGLRDVIKKYSKQNVLISQSSQTLKETVIKITKPVTVNDKSKSGWNDLYKFINQRL
ncbi:MAG TPA: glycosyltransferase family 4 protein [Candidatus Woesebacteria bacterium]|nr:glycosyltransferase family 4 protein [Candidatus Woesebacteria bacterium]